VGRVSDTVLTTKFRRSTLPVRRRRADRGEQIAGKAIGKTRSGKTEKKKGDSLSRRTRRTPSERVRRKALGANQQITRSVRRGEKKKRRRGEKKV
jgi:hypothetical protein